MVLSARSRIQCGMGRFCFIFLASFTLMRKVFWDGCTRRGPEEGWGEMVGGGDEMGRISNAERPANPAVANKARVTSGLESEASGQLQGRYEKL